MAQTFGAAVHFQVYVIMVNVKLAGGSLNPRFRWSSCDEEVFAMSHC